MSSSHYMAHQPRLPPPSSSSVAVLLTFTHLIIINCHIATVSPSSSSVANEFAKTPATTPTSTFQHYPFPRAGGDGTEWARNLPERNQSMLVITSDDTDIEQSFKQYQRSFNVTVEQRIDFVRGDGLSSLLWQAENPKYSTVLYVVSGKNADDAGLCDLSRSMSQSLNKTILFWPCPKMKGPLAQKSQEEEVGTGKENHPQEESSLPSHETVSFAVKSISQEFNWTEAVVFVAGSNWGLPLAVAANLHIPYRIQFNHSYAEEIEDKLGTVVIVTSPVYAVDFSGVLHKFRSLVYTKVLVIDTAGAIFSRRNHFSGYLATQEELDFVVEHWSENNFHSSSSGPFNKSAGLKDHETGWREKRSTEIAEEKLDEEKERETEQRKAKEAIRNVPSEQFRNETPSEHQHGSKPSTPKVFVVDTAPQSFLVLTVLTDKFKKVHDDALHVEFERRSGASTHVRDASTDQSRGVIATGAQEEEEKDDRQGSMNGNSQDPNQLLRRRQMKRSEEIIVTVNGTRNCNTTTAAKHEVDAEAGAANVPKIGVGSGGGDCTENNSDGRRDNESGHLLISKLPIFTSLTSSINESIQLLLSYLEERNCSLLTRSQDKERGGAVEVANRLLQDCDSALKCPSVADVNEQLFCNYLCGVVVNNSVAHTGSEPTTAFNHLHSSSANVPVAGFSPDGESRRFATQSEVVDAAERVCQQQAASAAAAIAEGYETQASELSLRNESSGPIQMQFSENLLYFYNENVVSKNNELVKRHKSKPMPDQDQKQPHYLAKDNTVASAGASHRLLKRDVPSSDTVLLAEVSRNSMNGRLGDEEPVVLPVIGDAPAAALNGHKESATVASHYAKYSEYFSLFDYIVATAAARPTRHAGANARGVDFILLDYQRVNTNDAGDDSATGLGWRPFLIMQSSQNPQVFTTHSILPGYNDWTLIPTQNLMECGLLCIGVIVLAIVIFCSIFVGGIVSAITIRKYLLRKRLSKGPNKVVLSAADFVFPVDSRRVDEGIEAMLCCFLQQLQEFGGPEVDKPDAIKGSISSLKTAGLPAAQNKNTSGSGSLARHNTVLDMRARYNGDLVQLKEIALLTGTELKTKAMDLLVMSHGLRHENINPFIGWLSDSNRTAMVSEYCSRGSLQDVLIMDDIKLDWSFRLSLLTDLVRGMRYLHSSPLRVHGGLTSRNCVVDARWVLKITDYGMLSFYDTIGIAMPAKSAKELLWTAPEALRNTKGFPKCGTQMGDVYSFGIIMQEVVVRGEPYCMLSLSPEEIIQKIKKPPPLIRPSVSKGAAPPEAINIMRQCWAEMPDMRPDFNTVYERFKQLNHGRKVNFVDTMFQMLEKYSNNLEELIRERTDQLDMERKKTEQLLNRMLPNTVAEKLKVGLCVEPEEFSEVTIYFSDIVGFTTIAAHCSPVQVVDLLNDLYTCFDATINAYNVYKVETIGDAYMVVSGLPSRIPDHAEQIATMALDLLHESGRFQVKHLPDVPLQLRIGLHSGPCCAGVVGLTMPRYCLFGDTVNTASRMESTGSSWRIHLSETTRDRLVRAGGYYIDSRGLIDIKGKGMMNTYWLLGKKGFDKPLPEPPPIGESHGLDESLIRNSIKTSQMTPELSTDAEMNSAAVVVRTAKNDTVEVKVEITPPAMSIADLHQQQQPQQQSQPPLTTVEVSLPVIVASASLDSPITGQATAAATATATATLGFSQQDFPPRASISLASPQQRKMSEFSQDSLLNPNGFTRMAPSPGANSSRLFKKIEEMMDLSSPYNHYRCLSTESNLAQCGGNLLGMGGMLQNLAMLGGNMSVPSPAPFTASPTNTTLTIPEQHIGESKLNSSGGGVDAGSRPGSGRMLRRQFSLDKDDLKNSASSTAGSAAAASGASVSNNLGNSACLQVNSNVGVVGGVGLSNCYIEMTRPPDPYQKHSSLPSISGQTLIHNNNNNNTNSHKQPSNRTSLFKQNSSSMSQDLEKIDENPGSPNPAIPTHNRLANHTAIGMYSQSSLASSIPFIDGSSCSSSVSTIPSSMVGCPTGPAPAGMTAISSGVRKLLTRDSQELETDGELKAEERRDRNLNVDPLLLRQQTS